MAVLSTFKTIVPDPSDGPFRWNAGADLSTPVIVTYSFMGPDDLPEPGLYGNNSNRFSVFKEGQKENFRDAVALYEAAAGLVFVEVENDAMINIHNAHGSKYGGWASLPYVNEYFTSQGVLVIDGWGNYDEGSYGFLTLIHELGHAVGLLHPHDGPNILEKSLDSSANTVMSYNFGRGPSYVSELGMFDLQALEYLYGGVVDVSDWVLEERGEVFAITASEGDDSIYGVAGKNDIRGLGGDDAIWGRDRNDVIDAGDGDDTVRAHSGHDIVIGGSGNDNLFGGYGDDQLAGGQGNDTLTGDEIGAGDDVLKGNQGNDLLIGGNGNDRLQGGKGKDTLKGGAGNDKLIGGDGADILAGGSGADIFAFKAYASGATSTILDFQLGVDKIDIREPGFTAKSLDIRDGSGGSTVVRLDAGNAQIRFVLQDIDHTDLSTDHFLF